MSVIYAECHKQAHYAMFRYGECRVAFNKACVSDLVPSFVYGRTPSSKGNAESFCPSRKVYLHVRFDIAFLYIFACL